MSRMLAIVLLAAFAAIGCTTTAEPEPEPVVETPVAQPTPAPEPEPVPVATSRPAPRELPKTASVLPLVGLGGLAALGVGGAIRAARSLRRR
jgi:hypothetical protein